MRAWVLHGIGDLRFETVEKPALKPGEVLVQVKAAGICGSDIPRIYQNGAHVHPLIPGHEFSGVVAEVGAGVDTAWLGQRVGVFPLIPCMACAPCQKEHYEMCRQYRYIGSRQDGAFAEYVAVPVWNLLRLPESVSLEEAAMLEPMAVAVHAMRRIHPSATDTVAVCGLGTIGLFLVMFLKEAGVGRVLTIGNKESQRRAAYALGVPDGDYYDCRCRATRPQAAQQDQATRPQAAQQDQDIRPQAARQDPAIRHQAAQQDQEARPQAARQDPATRYQDMHTQDSTSVPAWIRSRTEGLGVDVFFECVGKEETYAQAVESTAPLGRVMLVGNPFSDMGLERDSYWKILRDQLTVMGTWNSSFCHRPEDDWAYVLDRLAQKRIAPARLITHRFSMGEMEKGFHIMRDKTEDYGKVMGIF